jgi:hypothetical protein
VASFRSRRSLWILLAFVAIGGIAGGTVGWFYTRDRKASDVVTSTAVPSSTVVLPTSVPVDATATPTTAAPATAAPATAAPTTVAPTTVAPSTTAGPGALNPVGVIVGKPADAGSFNAAERWAATLGTNQAEAALSSKAALYTRWFRMAVGAPASVAVTSLGFRLTFADASVLDLEDIAGAGGKVADLTECPGGDASGNCQRVGDNVDLSNLEPAGTSASVTVRWLGRVRLRGGTWALYAMSSTKPVTSVTGAAPASFDGTTLMITGAVPGTPDGVLVTVAFTDGTSETLAIAV